MAEHRVARKPNNPVIMINGHIDTSTGRDRYAGYRDALKKFGRKSLRPVAYEGVVTSAQGYELAADILREHRRPLSILCYSDYVDTGVLRRLEEEEGVAVPGQVSIIGIDDIEFSNFTNPKLSTIAIPKRRIGIKSAEMLLEQIAAGKSGKPRKDTRFVHEVYLIARAST